MWAGGWSPRHLKALPGEPSYLLPCVLSRRVTHGGSEPRSLRFAPVGTSGDVRAVPAFALGDFSLWTL